MNNPIRGAKGGKGGGGGSPRQAQEAPDSLFSTQYARIQLLVSEGEIVGPYEGLKGTYLNETPVQNEDGSFNFEGIAAHFNIGTQAQGSVPGFSGVEREKPVSVQLKKGSSVTRRITDSNVDAVRLTIAVPHLTTQNKENGDLSGGSVSYIVEVQTDNGGFVKVISKTISGKTTSRYQGNHRIELAGDGPWDIRTTRTTADHDGQSHIQDETWWDSYTEIIDIKLRYPNSAIASIQLSSEQFSDIPSFGLKMRGLVIQIPSNYFPKDRSYIGHWDGTFKPGWTNNPAWIFYDLCTEKRYGLGQYLSADNIDKWALYEIARYCDEMVDDGYGTGNKEPRFTCNLVLQKQSEAFNVLRDLASVFRGVAYWGAGFIQAVQDRPTDAYSIYTEANVIDGVFNYSGTAKNVRHTVTHVSWNDPDDFYRQKIEYVEDAEGIAVYGINIKKVVGFGCSSRGQAHRIGKHILLTELMETESVNFKVGLDGTYLTPGQVIKIQDSVKSGGARNGGRVRAPSPSINDKKIHLDGTVNIEKDKSYTLACVLPDGSNETQEVINNIGESDVLTVDAPFSQKPENNAIWVLSVNDLVLQQFKIVGISDVGDGQLGIMALKHNPGKYAAIEEGIKLEKLPSSKLSPTLERPVNLTFEESLFNDQGKGRIVMHIGWEAVQEAVKFRVRYRRFNDNFAALPETGNRFVEVLDVIPGTYEIEVVALSALKVPSPPATITGTILGTNKIAVMPDIKNLKLQGKDKTETEFTGKHIKIEWDPIRKEGIPENAIFEEYEIQICDSVTGDLLRVINTKDNHLVYDSEKNAEGASDDNVVVIPPRFPIVISGLLAKFACSAFLPTPPIVVAMSPVRFTYKVTAPVVTIRMSIIKVRMGTVSFSCSAKAPTVTIGYPPIKISFPTLSIKITASKPAVSIVFVPIKITIPVVRFSCSAAFLITSKSVSVIGDVTIDTTIKKFGAGSGKFDGGHLSISPSPDFDFGAGDFTIDLWLRSNQVNSSPGILCVCDDTSDPIVIGIDFAKRISVWVRGINSRLTDRNDSLDGNWHHVAVVRKADTLYLFVDGNLGGSSPDFGTISVPYRNDTVLIGSDASGETFKGHIDEVRISKGVARWTSAFTPPVAPYTADKDTKLLVHMDGTHGSKTFVDSSKDTPAPIKIKLGPVSFSYKIYIPVSAPNNIKRIGAVLSYGWRGGRILEVPVHKDAQEGDLMIMCGIFDGSGVDMATLDSSWTVAADFDALPNKSRMFLARKLASANEPSTYILKTVGEVNKKGMIMVAIYRGTPPTIPIIQTVIQNGGANTEVLVGPVTPDKDNSLIITYIGSEIGNDGEPFFDKFEPDIGYEVRNDNVNGPVSFSNRSASSIYLDLLQGKAEEIDIKVHIAPDNTKGVTMWGQVTVVIN